MSYLSLVAVVLSEKSCEIQVKCCVTFIVDFLLRNVSQALFSETTLCNAHEISRKSLFLISGSGRGRLHNIPFLFVMSTLLHNVCK